MRWPARNRLRCRPRGRLRLRDAELDGAFEGEEQERGVEAAAADVWCRVAVGGVDAEAVKAGGA